MGMGGEEGFGVYKCHNIIVDKLLPLLLDDCVFLYSEKLMTYSHWSSEMKYNINFQAELSLFSKLAWYGSMCLYWVHLVCVMIDQAL